MTEPMHTILYRRRHEAFPIAYIAPSPTDWVPRSNRCHESATAWASRFPSWGDARGWLLVSEDDVLGAMFDAHSVVRDGSGRYRDLPRSAGRGLA